MPNRRVRRPFGPVPGTLLFGLALLAAAPGPAVHAQDAHLARPAGEIERRLASEPFHVAGMAGSRFEGDRTQRALLEFDDGESLLVKWARSAYGGGAFNNRPRYEVAAYEFQKLFLDEDEYVVPPTVARCFTLDWYRTIDARAKPTFRFGEDVLVVLQYWLWNVTAEGVWDEDRLERDTAYARHMANLNLFTHLAGHADANRGNVLVAAGDHRARVFAVDNGLAFGRERSNRGDFWRRLRVDRVPAATVERLRGLSHESLERVLGVVAQFERRDGRLVPVAPGPNLDPDDGVREEGGVLQLGLTEREIDRVWDRMQSLLEEVDEGDIEIF